MFSQDRKTTIKNNKPDFLNAEVSNKNALNNSQGYIP